MDFPALNAQTARALGLNSFIRSIRIKAHRGEVYLAPDAEVDSAESKHFDDFIKFEKRFAPHTDEFFVTRELHSVLPKVERQRFELFREHVVAGELRTSLYRLKRVPAAHAEDIFKTGDDLRSIKQRDWRYLRERITTHFLNVAARNSITKGLIERLDSQAPRNRSGFSSDTLLRLTLDALFGFLSEALAGNSIRLSYWRSVVRRKRTLLKMVAYRYPEGQNTDCRKRVVVANDIRYKVSEGHTPGGNQLSPLPSLPRA